jgi:hypothetical protein
MTGYKSKKAAAQDKLTQEPVCPECKAGVLYECVACSSNNYPAQPAQEQCCYHDSDCAVHNMPAYPAGPCDCTQQFKFWSVTGKYERQAFASLSGAEAYCKGLNTTYPEGNYVVRPLLETPLAAQPAQEPFGYLSIGGNPIFQKEKPEIGRWETLYTAPPQRPWVEPMGNEWFEWWRVSKVTDATEAEIDFADFLIIAQAVMTKLKEDNK